MPLLLKLPGHGQQEMTGWASRGARNLNQRASPGAYPELPSSPEAARTQR